MKTGWKGRFSSSKAKEGDIPEKLKLMSGQILQKGIGRNRKHNILILIILALVVRLFFSVYFGEKALAKKQEGVPKKQSVISMDPLKNINSENFFEENSQANICKNPIRKVEKKPANEREELYKNLAKGYPMAEMASEIAKKDKAVAAFLIAIAKKESDWGKHSPKKNGEDCYNYWGYRGGYNATDSGYSCFDNPAQAIAVVGGRIEDLINQEINTPERMIVWKCGRDCSWDNPVAVKKWISDVGTYYYKFNS
ncbi:MAG TPA: hypothetical protein P5232_01705 [Candidatus Moranbacteria bacterium]|nr:hypothetical protein [Candidatus Moranbacteria bacterium]